ncbi:alpha/beta hydrolase family protein [Pseudokordiimonas caeni]|uniref:alpha/beta hydrolase family protein n=1 Tax=Pseudokordiimonas caeni TaxID=2997908 RepID=UPI002810C266|nr:prolyl oligopeptidase family serine peptidase [Pseudokordiimonas caeni]
MRRPTPAVGVHYLPQANLTYAGGLKGKLLFIHGMLDMGVHPGALFQLPQALMDANKDFDLLLLPRAAHELPVYALRRQWDYFVANLAGKVPPKEYQIEETSSDSMKAKMKSLMIGEDVETGGAEE